MNPQPIGVCVIALDSQQRVLLGKRKNSYKAGWYGIPGGRLEHKEPIADCARRELREETRLEAVKLEYLGVIREVQEKGSFIHFVYVCREFTGQPVTVEPEKCEGWDWHALDALPENVLPGHRAALEFMHGSSETRLRDLIS